MVRSFYLIEILIFLFFLQLPVLVSAQKENNNWLVGKKMGLDFNAPPISGPGASSPHTSYNHDGILTSYGRKASISDHNGQLIFSTDGLSVWDADFNTIKGGDKIINNLGSQVVRESLIVRSGCRSFYIFSLTSVAPGVFRVYQNKVDIGANDGSGEVVEDGMSTLLYEGNIVTLNVISGFGHFWLFMMELDLVNNGSLRVFKIYEDEEPEFHSVVPLNLDFLNGQSFRIKFSKDAKTFNIVRYFLFEELPILRYRFDRSDGSIIKLEEVVPPPAFLQGYFSNHIDIEFSNNGVFAYVLSRFGFCEQLECFYHYKIFQYEIDPFTQKIIPSSEVEIYYSNESQPGVGNLTKGPRGKIYINRFDTKDLDVIFNPDSKGESCGYRRSYISWPEGSVALRMPNQVITEDKYYRAEINSNDFILCENESIDISFGDAYESITWEDGYSGFPRTISDAGVYRATLINGECIYEEEIVVLEAEPIDGLLPLDTVLCNVSSVEIKVDTIGFDNFIWSDGSNEIDRSISTSSSLSASFQVDNCLYLDTLNVDFVSLDDNPLPSDTTICAGESLRLGLSVPFAEFEWSDGSMNAIAKFDQEGFHTVRVQLSNCIVEDSVFLQVYERVNPTNTIDNYEICFGDSLELVLDDPQIYDYTWLNTGDDLEYWAKSGKHIYDYTDQYECMHTDTINLVNINCTEFDVYYANAFSPNLSSENNHFKLFIDEGVEVLEAKTSIFDRWGNRILTTNRIGNIWDGYLNGRIAGEGTYIWTGTYKIIDKNGESTQTRSGTVTLIH